MGAGRLDRKIDIERKTVTQAPSGQEVETWSKIATARAAAVRPLSGEERFTSAQFVAKQQVEFRVRYSAALAQLNPLDRIIYPPDAGSPSDSPTAAEPQIFDIVEVNEVVRLRMLSIKAVRRAEV
jgi:SPP1 family predicted phage head-tail adaptor